MEDMAREYQNPAVFAAAYKRLLQAKNFVEAAALSIHGDDDTESADFLVRCQSVEDGIDSLLSECRVNSKT